MYAIAPSPVIKNTDPFAARKVIARLLTRIISRAYGSIDQILDINIANDGLITCLFRDDDKTRKLIRLELGDRIEYKQVQDGRTDAVDTDGSQYLAAYANSIGQRTDKISKPKNCTVGTSCKGSCIAKGDVCRVDLPEALNRQEISDLNDAVIKSQSSQLPPISRPSDDPYEGLNIRELKEKAREKGILRYSYMTQDQLKGALKIANENPDYQENIRKTLQRQKDESSLKKARSTAIGRAIGVVSPILGRQYNLVASIGRKYENNPVEARILGIAALLGISVVTSKILDKNYKRNLVESAADAEKLADDRKNKTPEIKKPSITFVVGNYSEGSGAFAKMLKSKSSSASSKNLDWLKSNTGLVVVKRQGEGTPPPSDLLGRTGYNIAEGYKATLGKMFQGGRNPESVSLAADLFNYGSKTTSQNDFKILPALNVVAAEDGGYVAREAVEILSRMQRSQGGKNVRGVDIAKRINLVTLGTPYFGVSDRQIKETNLMGDQDPWNITPFKKGGAMTSTVQGVSGHNYRDYLKSGQANDALFSSLQTNIMERSIIEDFVVARKPTVAIQIAPTVKQKLADLGYTGEVGDAPQDLLDRAINQAKRERTAQRERDRVAGRDPDGLRGDSETRQDRKEPKCNTGNKRCGDSCVPTSSKCKSEDGSGQDKKKEPSARDSEGLFRPSPSQQLIAGAAAAGLFYGAYKVSQTPEEVKLAIASSYQDVLKRLNFTEAFPKTVTEAEKRYQAKRKPQIDKATAKVVSSLPSRDNSGVSNEDRKAYVEKLLSDPLRSDDFKFGLYLFGKNKKPPYPEELAAVRHYSDSRGYKEINMTLRGMDSELKDHLKKGGDRRELSEAKNTALFDTKMINAALDALPAYEGTTYRGLTLPQDTLDSIKVGGSWQDKGFTSTTKSMFGFYPGNVIMRVNSSSGRDISEYEKYPNNEVLFKNDFEFKVASKKKVSKLGKEFWLVDLEDASKKTKSKKSDSLDDSYWAGYNEVRRDGVEKTGKPCGKGHIPKDHKCSVNQVGAKSALGLSQRALATGASVALASGLAYGGYQVARSSGSLVGNPMTENIGVRERTAKRVIKKVSVKRQEQALERPSETFSDEYLDDLAERLNYKDNDAAIKEFSSVVERMVRVVPPKKGNSEDSWTPSMDRGAAEEWAKDTQIKNDFFHGTSKAGEAGISKTGWDLSKRAVGRVFGDAVYLSDSKLVTKRYAEGVHKADAATLTLKVNSVKPFVVEDFDKSTVRRPAPTEFEVLATKIGLRNRFNAIAKDEVKRRAAYNRFSKGGNPLSDKDIADRISKDPAGEMAALRKREAEILDFNKGPNRKRDLYSQSFVRLIQEAGYDSLQIKSLNYLMVFNPKNVVVVKEATK